MQLTQIFKQTQLVLGPGAWNRLLELCRLPDDENRFVPALSEITDSILPDYVKELAMLEYRFHQLQHQECRFEFPQESFVLNPTLEVIPCQWTTIDTFHRTEPVIPKESEHYALLWKHPDSQKVYLQRAGDRELLILKILAEDLSLDEVAKQGSLSFGQLWDFLLQCPDMGLVLGPPSKIERSLQTFPDNGRFKKHRSVSAFTLQWHITHACDLHCKHCYDRSKRSALTLEQGYNILRQFLDFCRTKQVRGHVCFTGGNPFLSPHFYDFYGFAHKQGFSTSILGNPVSRSEIKKMADIQSPTYYQVSLEGLPRHNDAIRGDGNFARVIEFLGVLRDLDIVPSVMLTLTKDNIDQVLPLAERLRGHASRFNFNRLSQVGEGAGLMLPGKEVYLAFLKEYTTARNSNPILGLKDNLLNPVREALGQPLFGGCTTYGCGAAFSFMAVLPDGEVHACRKFPSLIGNVNQSTLLEIFNSEQAEWYRRGSSACDACHLKLICGGCMAIAASHQRDIFKEKDPFCPLDDGSVSIKNT